MTISGHSSVSPVQLPPVQGNVPASKSQAQTGDTVQLSPEATKHLKSADTDGDGH